MMSWLSIVFFVARELPDLLTAVEEILHIVHGYASTGEAVKGKLSTAVSQGAEATRKLIGDLNGELKSSLNVPGPSDLVS